ncbi:ABC transporter ATP-binding protein [Virgibacillus salinus]|uniref:ABC-2 type transport system ATP-binding protein n=1 Tax=Virgibacillus salinus TaxID=553311 RepID=A0A1H1EPB4_9BACI|nr:ABC transporter ATP-binding protein [Virgibacillus salinus]SDQ90434.1 ABC-2 type transport system ATP-binding protein [Virgibacillus salinus]
MKVLELKSVETELGGSVLLSDISFAVEESSVVALVGHNGAGKSTLMKTILGELQKAKGEITINETSTQDEDFLTYKEQISYLPEEPLLLTELTVMQHFQLYAMSYGIEEAIMEEKIKSYTSGFELEDKLNEYPESLSKGMRQKVQTICALLPDTPLLLIDEPFMGLDVYAMDYLEELIREKAHSGTAVLLTSHQLERVKDIADTYIMLQHGEVLDQGPISDFKTIRRRKHDERYKD